MLKFFMHVKEKLIFSKIARLAGVFCIFSRKMPPLFVRHVDIVRFIRVGRIARLRKEKLSLGK